jgi:AcrR family transcriptional regulator
MNRSSSSEKRRTLDPEKTRQKILEAAFDEFATRGFSATSIAGIASRAKVQKSLVQYHFGTKDELWQMCLSSRGKPVIEEMDRFLNGEVPSLANVIEARFKMMQDNPELRKLLSWASMETLPVPRFIEERRERLLALLGNASPKPVRMLVALSAMDGWFMFGGLYRGGVAERVTELNDMFLEVLKELVTEK